VRVYCHECGEHLDVESFGEVEDHIRVLHPDLYRPLEPWPDGLIVIHDQTLTPDDFG
jgi:hypothetical protein